MPKSRVPKTRLFRDFALQDKKYIHRNYLKKLKVVKHFVNKEYDINFSHVEFLFWGYDLQFFTIKYAAESLVMNKNNTQNRFIYPLVNKGYIYKHLFHVRRNRCSPYPISSPCPRPPVTRETGDRHGTMVSGC